MTVHCELWISWVSLLRSYVSAHGLNCKKQAVIEVEAEEVVVRYGGKWIRFTHGEMATSEGSKIPFALNEDGTVMLDGKMDAMDFAAERTTRELMQ
ncbi:MAG: transcriptional regulator [Acidobacteriaceae bacterium]